MNQYDYKESVAFHCTPFSISFCSSLWDSSLFLVQSIYRVISQRKTHQEYTVGFTTIHTIIINRYLWFYICSAYFMFHQERMGNYKVWQLEGSNSLCLPFTSVDGRGIWEALLKRQSAIQGWSDSFSCLGTMWLHMSYFLLYISAYILRVMTSSEIWRWWRIMLCISEW